ncbi:M4 family metallopeptidase [Magnetospirillum sp. UT-4]|uniref:M4 family metallopeptidase n=1 Tax=Magnetospirillum sp. UT-4 TaxID=2681467 RepID=UPI00137E936B|nr:M4 family metallopeptidase [Magnetospirillum sp. UT-4]CAA7615224.1 putative Extracellular metalloprotease [Magnetospirillum sp. UT-4]
MHRLIFDAEYDKYLPSSPARQEGKEPSDIEVVNTAYDNAGEAHKFLRECFGRVSFDGRDATIRVVVRHGNRSEWRESSICLATDHSTHLDLLTHEFFHGVLATTIRPIMEGQSGALAESFCDVMGVLCRQWHLERTGGQAAGTDWMVGAGVFPDFAPLSNALRSLAAPGSVFGDALLPGGPQVAHFSNLVTGDADIYRNAGIPSHAFYLAATGAGGHAWTGIGRVWFEAFTRDLGDEAEFADAARHTIRRAEALGLAAPVVKAWQQVGVPTA